MVKGQGKPSHYVIYTAGEHQVQVWRGAERTLADSREEQSVDEGPNTVGMAERPTLLHIQRQLEAVQAQSPLKNDLSAPIPEPDPPAPIITQPNKKSTYVPATEKALQHWGPLAPAPASPAAAAALRGATACVHCCCALTDPNYCCALQRRDCRSCYPHQQQQLLGRPLQGGWPWPLGSCLSQGCPGGRWPGGTSLS